MSNLKNIIQAGLFCLLISGTANSFAQSQPRITILDLVYQGPAEYYQNSPLKDVKPATTTSADSTNKAGKKPQPPAMVLKPEDLQRITTELKGILFKQGAYRLIPPLKTIDHHPMTIDEVNKDIDANDFPESDFILFGDINYVNADSHLTSNTQNQTKSAALTLHIVGEFSLINTATKKVDAFYTVMGIGTDNRTYNIASVSTPLNKFKVLQTASSSLANAIAQELEIQLTPDLIQQRINRSQIKKPAADPNAITIK